MPDNYLKYEKPLGVRKEKDKSRLRVFVEYITGLYNIISNYILRNNISNIDLIQ